MAWAHSERSFLDRKEWVEIDSSTSQEVKPTFEAFVDLCCPIPGLKADVKSMCIARDPIPNCEQYLSDLSKVRSRVTRQLGAIDFWYSQWRWELGHQAIFTSEDVETYREDLFGSPLRFADLAQAKMYVWYHISRHMIATILIDLLEILQRVHGTSIIEDAHNNPHSLLRDAANSICRCSPYMLDASAHGFSGALFFRHVFMGILPTYAPEEEESMWIVEMLQRLPGQYGLDGCFSHVDQRRLTRLSRSASIE